MIFVKKSGHFRICIAAFLAGAILKGAGLETYLGIAEKTVRKYVLNHAIPYHKIMKIICYGYEMLCSPAVAGRSAPMLYFLCLPFLRLYLLLMAGKSYKRRIWYCPCTACRQQRAGRWMAAWQQLHQQLCSWDAEKPCDAADRNGRQGGELRSIIPLLILRLHLQTSGIPDM
jgi:hypothetical protein